MDLARATHIFRGSLIPRMGRLDLRRRSIIEPAPVGATCASPGPEAAFERGVGRGAVRVAHSLVVELIR